ncbi:MAG: right-handed parallel beta-helix repeat-containing protein, partial [Anaerolineales bacterium]|nr:right-handed parallel beta-helix repeat-containing protein [Anaerolineales bacterium]
MTHHTPFTRLSRLILGLLLGTALLAGLLAQLHATARAATAAVLDVCATCSYTTIQSAVDAASPGDTVRVAAGTYQDVVTASGLLSTTVLITKDLTLLGGFSPDFQTHDPATYVSTIDGQNSVKGIYVFGSQAHVAGFTIVNGLSHGVLVRSDFNGHPGGATLAQNVIQHNAGTGIVFYQASGEVLSSTVAHNLWEGVGAAEAHIRIADNVLTQNSLGGIWAGSAAITITGNTILSNTAEGGGGITLDNAAQFSVTHNLIQGNQAQLYSGGGVLILGGAAGILAQNDLVANTATDHGGGIAVYQNGGVTLSRNELRLNSAVYGGGGIHVNAENGSTLLTISENAIHDNTAEYATGVQVVNSSGDVLIDRNDVRFNHATGPDYSAGGIHVDNITGTVTVVNNVVAHNDNRGVKGVNYTEIVLINNTLVANGAVAIEMHAWPITAAVPLTATLINNIIADHPDCAMVGCNGAVFGTRHNDVVGHDLDDCGATIVSETGGLNADPLFVAAAQGDYRLAF